MARLIQCQLIEFYHLIGLRWTIPILYHIHKKPLTFGSLYNLCSKEINQSLLSGRLKKMIQLKIIRKEKIQKKDYYALTEHGKDLVKILYQLRTWAICSEYRLPKECTARVGNKFESQLMGIHDGKSKMKNGMICKCFTE